MVTCWILNSMTSELSEAFLYAQSTTELWKEIFERYSQSNGPLIYQLERELNNTTQRNLTLEKHFSIYFFICYRWKRKYFLLQLGPLDSIFLCLVPNTLPKTLAKTSLCQWRHSMEAQGQYLRWLSLVTILPISIIVTPNSLDEYMTITRNLSTFYTKISNFIALSENSTNSFESISTNSYPFQNFSPLHLGHTHGPI